MESSYLSWWVLEATLIVAPSKRLEHDHSWQLTLELKCDPIYRDKYLYLVSYFYRFILQ